MKRYEVFYIEEQIVNDQAQGGDDHLIKVLATEKKAIQYAKKMSFQKTFFKGTKKLYEVYLRFYNDKTDTTFVWFFKDGKLTSEGRG